MLEAVSLALADTLMVRLQPFQRIFSISAYSGAAPGLNEALGVVLPMQPQFIRTGDKIYMWSGPQSWLVFAADAQDLEMAKRFAAVTEQSDGRVVFHVTGGRARDALAKLIPIDLHDSVFPVGTTALTLAGHLNVQIWRVAEDVFGLACFRSFANALYEALTTSCREFES